MFLYLTEPYRRAISGLSMGGFHSLEISKEYPDMFNYVDLFSAATHKRANRNSEVYNNFDENIARQFANPPALYFIAIGNMDFLYDEYKEFREYLDLHKYPYVYRESADGHIWEKRRIYLTEFLPKLIK